MMFNRKLYYSQTDVVKRFKVSIKQFKQLLVENNIPQINKEINLGMFEVTTIYVLKSDIDKLNLEIRS